MVNEVSNNIRILQINERSVQSINKMESPEKINATEDKLALSEQGQRLNKMAAEPLPVSMEKLLEIKNAILSGQYMIDHSKVADALLNRNVHTL